MTGGGQEDGKNRAMVPAVEQAAKILLYFADHEAGRANLTEICQALGLYKSRGYAILKTMAAYGLIERDEATKRYGLGPAVVLLSRKFLGQLDIREKALPLLEGLARETGCTALLGIISGEQLLVTAKQDGEAQLGITIELGHRFHLTAGAHGKAVVSFLPAKAGREIMARRQLYFHGRAEKLDRERLDREMAACRQDGYALDMGDLQPGIHAAAAPVFGGRDEIAGALIVIGTFPREEAPAIGSRVRAAAGRLSLSLGANPPRIFRPEAAVGPAATKNG